jgi:hypothetical protein
MQLDPDDPRVPLLTAKNSPAVDPFASLSEQHGSPSSVPVSPEIQDAETDAQTNTVKDMDNLSRKSQWIVLALASGACAAFNGVFAKL